MEAPQTSSPAPSSCFNCSKLQTELSEALKRCSKCQTALYCSQDCQKANWKSHKLTCHRPRAAPPPPPNPPQQAGGRHNPGFEGMNVAFGLDKDDFLHNIPGDKAFNYLIDCFRMRVEDEYVFGGNTIGIYNGDKPLPEFKKFLSLAESRQAILPPWWSPAKRWECERLAVNGTFSNIHGAVEKSDIQEQYNDNMMPMKLRVLGEKIYGKGFM
jgi:splicing suppressor protein 51